MKHFLNLTLKRGKIEGIVTCADHETCPANRLIQQDEEEMGDCSTFPTFLEWYQGTDTVARSGEIHLELSEGFVQWTYIQESSLPLNEAPPSKNGNLYYIPVITEGYGLQNVILPTPEDAIAAGHMGDYLKDDFFYFYSGKPTELRHGFVQVTLDGGHLEDIPEEIWDYSETPNPVT